MADVKPRCNVKVGWRPGSRLELAEEALKRYDADPLYRCLHERVGQLFAKQLKEDLEKMGRKERIGLCAKWCPLLYHSFDRRTLICESIARWMFPANLPEFQNISERQYAYRARDMLRKSLSDLKEYIKSPERLMCQHRWKQINYRCVPATCMRNNAKHFDAHDNVRFQKHISALVSKQVKAKTGALQPHQLLQTVSRMGSDARTCEALVAQAQWEALVDQVRTSGAMAECIAVCDVSGSMSCQAAVGVSCMDVAIALSLLLAEVASGSLQEV